MPIPPVAPNFHKTFNIGIHLAPKVPFDLVVLLNSATKGIYFFSRKVVGFLGPINSKRIQNGESCGMTNTVNVC